MGPKTLRFWLLVVSTFALTQPGSIAFANFDAPYSFYKDLATWLSSATAGLILVLVYGAFEWRRGRLSRRDVLLALAVLTITVATGYQADLTLNGKYGYRSGILEFLVGGFPGLLLSLMLLPTTVLSAFTGGLYYPYDRPLVIAWVVTWLILATLLVGYIKGRRLRDGKTEALQNHPEGQEGHDDREGFPQG